MDRELKDRRIRSNVLSPGSTDTPQVTRQPVDAIARIVSTIPMGRMGEPDRLASIRRRANGEGRKEGTPLNRRTCGTGQMPWYRQLTTEI
jgi:NAD(P)-dependent dehydrogenase (short-subunit alcohol dehydrogenase family)